METPTFGGVAHKNEEKMHRIAHGLPPTPSQEEMMGEQGMMMQGGQEQQMDSQQMQALMQRPESNPFAAEQYNNVQVPDQPITYGGGMAESMLNDNEVPEPIRKKFWWVFHKDNTLTFLDDQRKNSKLLNFDITKIDMLNAMPYYDYTFEKELQFGVLRNVFETKLDRALGFKGQGQKNERIVLQSQFSEQRQISENSSGTNNIREGFFRRLLSRR